jgi:hypothetical protein
MKTVLLAIIMAATVTLAHAEDMAEMVSRYRREHGLSSVKIDPQLTAIAERQAKAMAASGIMDHSVAGSFATRISGADVGGAAENIAAGTHSWADTFRMWQKSPGHNANLLRSRADRVGFAVARNEQTRYKTFWAMVIAEGEPSKKERQAAAREKAVAARTKTDAARGKTIAAGEKTDAARAKTQERQVVARAKTEERRAPPAKPQDPLSTVKNFVCKYLCP